MSGFRVYIDFVLKLLVRIGDHKRSLEHSYATDIGQNDIITDRVILAGSSHERGVSDIIQITLVSDCGCCGCLHGDCLECCNHDTPLDTSATELTCQGF